MCCTSKITTSRSGRLGLAMASLVLAWAGVLLWACPASAQAATMTANFTFAVPADVATGTYVDYSAGSGTWAAAPGSPLGPTVTTFTQSALPVGTVNCWRFTRKGGGVADGDPVVTCGQILLFR